MTIKSKLITNVSLTAALIIAISLVSYVSLRGLQDKLSYLTQKSTPFRMRTIELQRGLQAGISALSRMNTARSMPEYTLLREEAEKNLGTIEDIRYALDKMSAGSQDLSDELDKLALELFFAVEDRISSGAAANIANVKALKIMSESTARLDELNSLIRNLQISYAQKFTAALAQTATLSDKLRSIEELRNIIRELQLIAVTVQTTHNSNAILISRAKLNSLIGRITHNNYYIANNLIAASTKGFTDKLTEYVRLQSVATSQKDPAAKQKAAEMEKDLPYRLNDLFQTLDQETMLVRDELTLANSRQGDIFAKTEKINRILVADSEMVALGLRVTNATNRLFIIDSQQELNRQASEIRTLFAQIHERAQVLEKNLPTLNESDELKMLRSAIASLVLVRNEIDSAGGIVATLTHKLSADARALKTSARLQDLVVKQIEQGNQQVAKAQGEQEKSVATIDTIVKQGLFRILVIGCVAIMIGFLFGFWIYRSLLQPLNLILNAIIAQRKQGEEKSKLAEAIAGGDLNRDMASISEGIILDPAQIQDDEMGMVLSAVSDMSRSQATLDRALADMTRSLRTNKAEELRVERLKNGLYEINRLMRGEQTTAELADKTLAYIAAFLDAGVGIMYLYDEKHTMLHPVATYAVSLSERPNQGIKPGEGLAGQVLLERKMIRLDSVPANYLQISSALGAATPVSIIVLPIMYNDVFIGALELGSFKTFENDDFDFLNKALEDIAIAINVNRSRQLVNDLLEQTQLQSDELQVKQDMLQQTNEELEERVQMGIRS